MAEPPVGGPTNPTLIASGGNPLQTLIVEGAGFHPAKAGKVFARPGLLALTWLGPQPLGFVPPHAYGLPEDYLFGIPKDITELFLEPADFRGGSEHLQLEAAQRAAAALARLQANIGMASDADLAAAEQLADRLNELRASSAYFRERLTLPAGIYTTIDEERYRRLRAAPPDTEPVMLLQALQAVNPPDP